MSFTHFIAASPDWESGVSICGTKPEGEKWISRKGTGKRCNACSALASRMSPPAVVNSPPAKWLSKYKVS